MKPIKHITLICASFVLTTITSGQDTLKFERTTTIQTLENGNINIATNPMALQQTLDSIYALHARMADSLQAGTVTGTSKFLRLLETLETGGDVLVGGDLEVIGSATIGGTTFANGGLETTNLETDNITVSENGSFGQDVSVGGTLTVTGATTLNSTLSAQTSTLSSATITGDASIGGNTSMTGALDVDGSSELDGLNVDGATTMDAFTADGNADINGNADVSGTLNAGASTLSSATITGDASVGGNTSMTGALDVDGSSELDGLNVDGATTMDAFTADGNADINGNADVSGTLNAGASTLSSATITGDASIGGNTSMTGALDVDGSSELDGLNVDGATTLDAFTADGNADINGNADVSGTLDVNRLALDTLAPKSSGTQITVVPGSTTSSDLDPASYPLRISGENTGMFIELDATGNPSSQFAQLTGAEQHAPPATSQNFITFATTYDGVENPIEYGRIEGTGNWTLAISALFTAFEDIFNSHYATQSSNEFASSRNLYLDIKNHWGLSATSTVPGTDYFPGYLMVKVKAAQWDFISSVEWTDESGVDYAKVDTVHSLNGEKPSYYTDGDLVVWTGKTYNTSNNEYYSDVLGSTKTTTTGNCDEYGCSKWVFIDPIKQPGRYIISVPEGSANDWNGLELRWINPNAIGDANLCGSCDEKKTWGKLDPENRVGIRMSRMDEILLADFNWSIEDHSFLELFTGTGDDEWHLKTSDTLKVTPSISCATLTNDECPGGPRIGDVKKKSAFFENGIPPYFTSQPDNLFDAYDFWSHNENPTTGISSSEDGYGVSDGAFFDVEEGTETESSTGEVGGQAPNYGDGFTEPGGPGAALNSLVSALNNQVLEEIQMVVDILQNTINTVVSFFPPGVPFDFFDIVDAASELFMSIYDLHLYIADGTGSTGIQFVSRGADYAEFVPKAFADERMTFGDVVGVRNGVASKTFVEADHFFVVSKAPVVLGNAIDEQAEAEANMEKLAFLGQVPVKVRGKVKPGDYVLASQDGSGIAAAKNPADMQVGDYSKIVGIAWGSDETGTDGSGKKKGPYHLILTAIGLDNNNFVAEMEKVQNEVDQLHEIVNALASSLNELGAKIEMPLRPIRVDQEASDGESSVWTEGITGMVETVLHNETDKELFEAAKLYERNPEKARRMMADILEGDMEERFGFDMKNDIPWFRNIIEDPEYAASVREASEKTILALQQMMEARVQRDKTTSNVQPEKTMPGASNSVKKTMLNTSNKSEQGSPRPKIR